MSTPFKMRLCLQQAKIIPLAPSLAIRVECSVAALKLLQSVALLRTCQIRSGIISDAIRACMCLYQYYWRYDTVDNVNVLFQQLLRCQSFILVEENIIPMGKLTLRKISSTAIICIKRTCCLPGSCAFV